MLTTKVLEPELESNLENQFLEMINNFPIKFKDQTEKLLEENKKRSKSFHFLIDYVLNKENQKEIEKLLNLDLDKINSEERNDIIRIIEMLTNKLTIEDKPYDVSLINITNRRKLYLHIQSLAYLNEAQTKNQLDGEQTQSNLPNNENILHID